MINDEIYVCSTTVSANNQFENQSKNVNNIEGFMKQDSDVLCGATFGISSNLLKMVLAQLLSALECKKKNEMNELFGDLNPSTCAQDDQTIFCWFFIGNHDFL